MSTVAKRTAWTTVAGLIQKELRNITPARSTSGEALELERMREALLAAAAIEPPLHNFADMTSATAGTPASPQQGETK
jgi:hypothetical protein